MQIEKIEQLIKQLEIDLKYKERWPSEKYRKKGETALKNAKIELNKLYNAYHNLDRREEKLIRFLNDDV